MFTSRSFRLVVPIAIGLAVIAFALIGLMAAPVRAIDHESAAPIDSASPIVPLAPNLTVIPLATPPTINGVCDPAGEYADALALPYTDAFSTTRTVYVKHDNIKLYVCMVGAAGTFDARFASVYLDTFNSRLLVAGSTDYALRADIITGTLSSFKGTGVPNGYTPINLSGWTAATAGGPGQNFDIAEYAIPLSITGGWCGQPFGLAVYHHWVKSVGDDYGWPSATFFDSPKTWTEVSLQGTPSCAGQSNLAYVYKRDTTAAADFKALLEGAGFTVDLIPQSAVTATNFTPYHAILIADDTGELDTWGAGLSQISPITTLNKPIIGIGEGGYAFFGQLGSFIGWPNGWHGPQDRIVNPDPAPGAYYVDPYNLTGLLGSPIGLYSDPVNEVGIYVPNKPPSGITVLGWEPASVPSGLKDHAPLIVDGCHQLWGFSESPTRMNATGQRLFINAVIYGRFYTACRPIPVPPQNCLTVTKTATPVSGSTVQPGDAIHYTLAYTVANTAGCATQRSVLMDKVPVNTLYVPGSASDGITPNFEDNLIWDLGPLAQGATGSQQFRVSVMDTACRRQEPITNTARLQNDLGVFTSNTTTHPVNCPPIGYPNDEPPYAESEIEIYPYPMVAGRSTEFSVRVMNHSASAQVVTVTFQTSPARFGIGIPFSAITVPGNPRVIVVPAHGEAEVKINWAPPTSGHYCIQVKVESAGYAPIYTQRNLDVTENLQPGVTDVLTFSVANPTSVPATITLVVDNTCPGWSAVLTPTNIIAANPGNMYTSTLRVTPPNPAVLGTGCHIDIQGWIGDRLIGGIRKLDVPPVNLTPANPPWREREITTIPTTPISGTVNQFCVELQNPLTVSKQVTVTFSEAAFGAGVGFTPFMTQTYTLPPGSIGNHCVNWTPMPVPTLHRCLLVTLRVPGFLDQHSQLNVDIVQPSPTPPGGYSFPFMLGNPHDFTSEIDLQGILIGLNQWQINFDPPLPDELLPNQVLPFTLHLVPLVNKPTAITDTGDPGDSRRVDLYYTVNGETAGGFSVSFEFARLYLPLIMK